MSLPIEVVASLREDRCVLFLGSRASAEAAKAAGRDYPTSLALAKRLGWEKPRQIMGSRARPVMPSVEKGAARFEAERGRQALLNEIRPALDLEGVAPAPSHQIAVKRFRQIFTTCWDVLLEKAATEAGYEVSTGYRTEPLPVSSSTGSRVVVRIRGSFEAPQTLVITEADFRTPHHPDFKRAVRKLIHERTVLFVGYRPDEEEFERLWEDLTDAYGGELPRCHMAVPQGRMDDFLWQKWVWRGLLLFTADPEECLTEIDASLGGA